MPRSARIVIPGIPHHITHRGNDGQDIFFAAFDRLAYLNLLGKYSKEFGLDILGYCLMTTHIHLISIPATTDSFALAFGRTQFQYTQYINRHYQRHGHLWENRFFSCPMDEEHTGIALCYVDRNPTRARLCTHPWEYRWSSAAAHIGKGGPTGLLNLAKWSGYASFEDWKLRISEEEDEAILSALRTATSSGRPWGSRELTAYLEERTGSALHARHVGRPSKYRRR